MSTVQIGFYGKIPARGDFVRQSLPRGFIDPWDEWLRVALDGSRSLLGQGWTEAWMEAPIWRFRLAPGVAGGHCALGLFLPSIDRAGRMFPLTLACLSDRPLPESWLDHAETAGLAAIEQDLDPDALQHLLLLAPPDPDSLFAAPPGRCQWWTQGAPRVPATEFTTTALPDAACFARMLDSSEPATEKPDA
jgi:type VI secretion system protein ImpM